MKERRRRDWNLEGKVLAKKRVCLSPEARRSRICHLCLSVLCGWSVGVVCVLVLWEPNSSVLTVAYIYCTLATSPNPPFNVGFISNKYLIFHFLSNNFCFKLSA